MDKIRVSSWVGFGIVIDIHQVGKRVYSKNYPITNSDDERMPFDKTLNSVDGADKVFKRLEFVSMKQGFVQSYYYEF